MDVASDITFACSHIARPDLGTALIENYVHADKTFCLESFPRNTVTRRLSVSSHAEKLQHSNKLSSINFYSVSKVKDLVVYEFLFELA